MARATGTAMPASVPTSGAYGPLAQTLVRIFLTSARLSLRTGWWNTTPGNRLPGVAVFGPAVGSAQAVIVAAIHTNQAHNHLVVGFAVSGGGICIASATDSAVARPFLV